MLSYLKAEIPKEIILRDSHLKGIVFSNVVEF
jgi:hypothetical protein